jgi:hypothetical protein
MFPRTRSQTLRSELLRRSDFSSFVTNELAFEVLANVLKQFDSKNLDTRPVDSGAAHVRERI